MQKIELDLAMRRIVPLLHAKQNDVGKKVAVALTDNGTAYSIPGDAVFSVWYSGASGEGNYTTIDGRSAFSVSGNTVTVELITQMLQNKGPGQLCLVMNGANGTQLGLWNIPYVVEEVPGAGSKEATAYYTAFLEAVQAMGVAGIESTAHPGCYYRIVNGKTEWLNPPMIVGEEYRTTERWNGKAVYTKVVDCGALPNADFKSIAHSFGATNIIRSHGMMVTSNGGVAIPYRVHDITFSETVDLAVNKNSIMITTGFDASANTAHVTVWYTKD